MKIVYTDNFAEYMRTLKDRALYTMIIKRLERVSLGNFGDTKLISQGIFELRIHHGSGHRIYYTKKKKNLSYCSVLEINQAKKKT